MAYKLILPEENSVHLVFHVSLLNKKVGNVVIVSSILLEVGETGMIIICHVAILDMKLMKKDKKVMVVGLNQWSNSFHEDATWKDLEKIQLQFSRILHRFLRYFQNSVDS